MAVCAVYFYFPSNGARPAEASLLSLGAVFVQPEKEREKGEEGESDTVLPLLH